MGLGDTLYMQSIARHLVEQGQVPEVCTKYPDVFKTLFGKVVVSPFRRDRVDRIAHYIGRKKYPDTDQFRDCCISARVTDVDLRLDWKWRNKELEQSGKPVVIVQMPRVPMGRVDKFGDDLLPDCRKLQQAIDLLRGRATIVQIGKGKPIFWDGKSLIDRPLRGIDIDLANKTTVAEMITAAATAQGFLGYCSFIAPLAESLKKPLQLIFSRRGMNSHNQFIRQITPQKIFYLPSSRSVVDDCTDQEMTEAINAFFDTLGSPATV